MNIIQTFSRDPSLSWVIVYVFCAIVTLFIGRWFYDGSGDDNSGVVIMALGWPLVCVFLIAWGIYKIYIAIMPSIDVFVAIRLAKVVCTDDRGTIKRAPHLPGESEPFVFVEFGDPSRPSRRTRRRVAPAFAEPHQTPTDAIASFWGLTAEDYHPDAQS